MKDLAKQELKILEAQHPTRFHYLKLQLEEFIHLLDQEEQQSSKHKQQPSIIQTEESSSTRKRQREEEEEKDDGYSKPKTKTKTKTRKRGEGFRDAIHKAHVCLHKIQTFKSLFCSSNR
ncbi:hypothetical protein QVD17_05089 [Tagetes erecta]|uniref:Uncharacterized protein n=1 Tax=Tagetes erecta TaxID=13708 RepID=A0AAD8LDT6_TARER|nr:hypothetical protein QVD17_05089 [Tagetes erecta]